MQCEDIEGDLQLPKHKQTDFQVLTFIIGLCFFCALILAVVAYSLSSAQEAAKVFDQSKQMLIATRILNHQGFLEGEDEKANEEQIKAVAAARIRPLLTDSKGAIYTLDEKNISLEKYLSDNQKKGYANLELKLFYAILPADKEESAEQIAKDPQLAQYFVIPVSGFGLWAPIYGYIAIEPNGDSVVGTTWYDMGETPGLGANITESWWQDQFEGKLLFHVTADGKTDFQTADIGIIVVKGKVQNVYGSSPKGKNAVDGISGATLTGDGVSAAYKDSLTPYRAFLIKLHEEKK